MSTSPTKDDGRPAQFPRRALAVLFSIAAALILHYAYIRIINPEFSYFGYSLSGVDTWDYGVALAIVSVCAACLPTTLKKPSDTILWVIFCVAGIPSIVVPHYGGPLSSDQAAQLSLHSGIALVILIAGGRWNPLAKVRINFALEPHGFWLALLVWTGLTCAIMILTFGIPTSAPSLSDVYDVRSEYKESISGSALLGYLIPIQAGIINTLFLARGLSRRSFVWFFIGLTGQAFIFATSGLKSVAFSGLAVLAFYWLLSRKYPAGWMVPFGIAVGSAGSMFADLTRGGSTFSTISIRRFLITPGLLAAAYVSTFTGAEKGRWAYSFLSGFVNYPYSETPSYLVGRVYFGRPGMNANANFIADGYANLGVPGIVIEAIFIVVLLGLVDAATRGLPNRIGSVMFIVPAIAFANSSAFTTAGTHGVIFGIFLAALLPRTGWSPPSAAAEEEQRVGTGFAPRRPPSPAPGRIRS